MFKSEIEFIIYHSAIYMCVFTVYGDASDCLHHTQFYFYFILILFLLLSRVMYREQQLKLHNEAKQKAKELALEQEIEKQKRLDRLRQQVK